MSKRARGVGHRPFTSLRGTHLTCDLAGTDVEGSLRCSTDPAHAAALWECGCFGDGPQQRDADGAVPPSNAAAAAVPLSCELQPWEAAFLALELGCLTVRRGGAALDGGAVRRALCAAGAADALYAVYSHLRWKHWVVRDGGLYGGDFLLYRRAPDADHAAFVVIVQDDRGDAVAGAAAGRRCATFLRLQAACRLASSVKKRLLICAVSDGDGDSGGGGGGSRPRVSEALFEQWAPALPVEREGAFMRAAVAAGCAMLERAGVPIPASPTPPRAAAGSGGGGGGGQRCWYAGADEWARRGAGECGSSVGGAAQ